MCRSRFILTPMVHVTLGTQRLFEAGLVVPTQSPGASKRATGRRRRSSEKRARGKAPGAALTMDSCCSVGAKVSPATVGRRVVGAGEGATLGACVSSEARGERVVGTTGARVGAEEGSCVTHRLADPGVETAPAFHCPSSVSRHHEAPGVCMGCMCV